MSSRAAIRFLATFLAAYAAGASGQIYRCSTAGAVSYQEFPCPASADGAAMAIGADFPAVNLVERERLLQREAALDARILKRAEIDASERIARDDRIARELTLQAQLERERVETASYYGVGRPLYGYPRAARRPWAPSIR